MNGHANIVQLYDVFINEVSEKQIIIYYFLTIQELVVLVMELLEGGELFTRVVNSGAYSEREASKHFKRITVRIYI